MSPADPEHPDKTSEHRPALDADAGARPATVSRQGYGNADYHVSHGCVHRPSDLVATWQTLYLSAPGGHLGCPAFRGRQQRKRPKPV